MKGATLFLLLLLSQHSNALQIYDVGISAISGDTINVSLNTEAVELYYFHSWQYSVSGSTITIEACFVEGFGSLISYLNNNFEVPLNTNQPGNYQLIVKIYFADELTFYDPENLQDEMCGNFSTPFFGTQLLQTNSVEMNPVNGILYTNPSDGKIVLQQKTDKISIYDASGRKVANFTNVMESINLSNLANGIYYLKYYKGNQTDCFRLILKKE